MRMFTFGGMRLRIGLLAALIAISASGVRFFDAQAWTLAAGTSPQTIDATSLMASLPAGLTPPTALGLRVVSMIAEDIDADGDLDVVANDGSLDLIVWTNDGRGSHPERRRQGRGDLAGLRPEPVGGGRPSPTARRCPTPSRRPTFASLDTAIRACVRDHAGDQSPLWSDRSGDALLTTCVLSRGTPRGPLPLPAS